MKVTKYLSFKTKSWNKIILKILKKIKKYKQQIL